MIGGRRDRHCHPHFSKNRVGEVLWTEESEAHIARHGVTPTEVEQALYSRPRLSVAGRDDTRLVLGTSDAGKYLFVVVTEAADGRDFVVTGARDDR